MLIMYILVINICYMSIVRLADNRGAGSCTDLDVHVVEVEGVVGIQALRDLQITTRSEGFGKHNHIRVSSVGRCARVRAVAWRACAVWHMRSAHGCNQAHCSGQSGRLHRAAVHLKDVCDVEALQPPLVSLCQHAADVQPGNNQHRRVVDRTGRS